MKFKHKIWMLPLSAATFFAVGLLASFWVSSKTADALTHLRQVDYPYLQGVQRLDRDVDQLRLLLQSAAAEGDRDRLQEARTLAEQAVLVLQGVAGIEGKEDEARRLQAAYAAYVRVAVQATEAMLRRDASNVMLAEMQQQQQALYHLVALEIAAATQATQDRQAEADKGVNTSLLVNLLTGLVVLLMLANASSLIVRSVWRDLGSEPADIRTLMNEVALGHLDVRPKVSRGDSISIAAGLRDMVVRMAETVLVIRQVADNIKASAELGTSFTAHSTEPGDGAYASSQSAKARAQSAQADRLLDAVSVFKLP